ncbi:MAG: hypothetical protein C0410_00770 [Anaerolinea sp.]|nr:hypothetical protein [Anaerolinea sp.]
MSEQLDPELLKPIEKVARFLETGDEIYLSAFAKKGVVIIENFKPHLFEGEDALQRWSNVIKSWHTKPIKLVHSFGQVQDLNVGEDLAFVSMPTHWTGLRGDTPFQEDGGWAFVLVKEEGQWKVRNYGWAVTHEEEG